MWQKSNGSRDTIQIGEVAGAAGLSIDTIRFYERQGLLPKAPRSAGRFRLYTANDVTRLAFIKQTQSIGFSLQEIKQLLNLRELQQDACHDVRDLLNAKLKAVPCKIPDLKNLEYILAADLRRCNRELQERQRQAPKACPVLQDSRAAQRRSAC